MTHPFFTYQVTPGLLRTRGVPAAARELAARVEDQALRALEACKDEEAWQLEVRLVLHGPPEAQPAPV